MKNKKIKFLVLLLLTVIFGYTAGFLFNNYRLLRDKSEIGVQKIDISKLEYDGFEVNNDKLISATESPKIVITNDDYKYVKKLIFNYKTLSTFSWKMKCDELNVYSVSKEEEIIGAGNDKINIFVENISKKVKKLEIEFNLHDKIEIQNIAVNNSVIFLSLNYSYFIVISVAAFLLVFFRKYLINHLEFVFLVLALSFGIVVLINHQIDFGKSQDDQIHFENSYGLVNRYHTETTYYFYDANGYWINNNFVKFNTDEEKNAFKKVLNQDFKKVTNVEARKISACSTLHYYFDAIIFKIGSILKLDFSFIFTTALFFNLILYITIVFFAIRKAPVAKYLFLVVGLIPDMLFMACSYSYDPPITAFVMLGFSYYLFEMKNKKKKLTTKDAFMMIIPLTIGVLAKPVYAFLSLILLTLPKEKFYSVKQKRLFNVLCFLISIFAVLAIVILTTGGEFSDARGGDTDMIEQLKLIIHQPLSFAKVFIANAGLQFLPKFFSAGTLFTFGYFGQATNLNSYYLFLVLLILAPFTDSKSILNKKSKILLFVLVLICASAVWGSLYLSFTPVGADTMNGVQNRYFIPLILPLLLLLQSNSVKLNMDSKIVYNVYTISLFIIIGFILFCNFI